MQFLPLINSIQGEAVVSGLHIASPSAGFLPHSVLRWSKLCKWLKNWVDGKGEGEFALLSDVLLQYSVELCLVFNNSAHDCTSHHIT